MEPEVSSFALRRERNSATFLNYLPEELVSSIFLSVIALERWSTPPDAHHHFEAPPAISSLFDITHICHRLRTIAIRLPFLWTTLDSRMTKDLVDLFVQRSAGLPFRVYFRTGRQFPIDTLLPVFSCINVSRIQELFVTMTVNHYYPFLPHNDILLPLSPTLNYLNLVREGFFTLRTRNPEIFRGRQNILVALVFSLKVIPPPRDYFPCLAHLRIAGTKHMDGSGTIDSPDLLRLLANTPSLETLYVIEAEIVWDGMFSVMTTETVRLERLRVLCFYDQRLGAILNTLSCLALNPDVILQLHRIKYLDNTTPQITTLPPLGELTHLEIASEGEHYHIRASGPDSGVWFQFLSDFQVIYAANTSEDVLACMMDKLGPSLRRVHTLRIAMDAHTHLIVSFLRRASPLLPTLHTLLVASENADGMDFAAALGAALVPGEPPLSTPCPTLQKLHIQVYRPIAWHAPIEWMLDERARLGHPIAEVLLSIGCRNEAYPAPAAEYAEMNDVLSWDFKSDPFWLIETPYWPLYPPERDMHWLWGPPKMKWDSLS
ncbi:hypothetical protein BD309DRAFT_945651 [Dichomitus squalens]|uniref:Uncharacterized protein n=1 Tax=Dichomitus squalens TaxID=114155 RepID=A0A4V2K632_9APHY|nr:hypothetical protein BD309DRAFT_945651 [Dichomitus squalens]TBU65336.1 hypothetical protein BD310DRAFT_911177 [Dichomitus squalens]